jgi:hypothetical protein
MNCMKAIARTALLASTMLLSATIVAARDKVDEVMSLDGLQKVKVKNVDLAYVRPGASLAGYNSVRIDPVNVAFRKDWDPTRTGSRIKLSTEEREKIRNGLAQIVHDEFVRELQAKSGYKVVTESGPDVLRVKVNVVNVFVNAPDTNTPGRSTVYVMSAGEMTLFAELVDSETGEVIARFADRREARTGSRMEISSTVFNTGQAAGIASNWARLLRNGLDNARAIGKK